MLSKKIGVCIKKKKERKEKQYSTANYLTPQTASSSENTLKKHQSSNSSSF